MVSKQTDLSQWIFPSDARSFTECKRKVWFDRHPPKGLKVEKDMFNELLAQKGMLHEAKVKEKLSKGKKLVEASSQEHTLQLMIEKIPIIYQPQLRDEALRVMGDPDFLILNDDQQYQAADAKLANSSENHDEILIQLGIYRKLLKTKLPALVYLGNGEIETVGEDSDALTESYLSEMRVLLGSPQKPMARYADSKCNVCPYLSLCRPEFTQKEELTLLPGIDSRLVKGLESVGIQTISQLAGLEAKQIPDVPYLKGEDKKYRAVLQAQAYMTGKYFVLEKIDLRPGTWVHFDIEANPLTDNGENQVYLWGFLLPSYGQQNYEYIWSDSLDTDKEAWIKFIEKIEQYKSNFKDLVLTHYSVYEKTWVRKYAERYQMLNHPIVEWLLDEKRTPFYDLLNVVKNNLVLPLNGYGLKAICKDKNLVNFQWQQEESGSQWSVVQYLEYLNESSPAKKESIKKSILMYNYDDVLAMEKLKEWLKSVSLTIA